MPQLAFGNPLTLTQVYWGALIFVLFFFSSRRRHTRFSRDWSSDVCSSDLKGKVRYLGVTEAGSSDPEHAMVERAVEDGVWDVVMVAFHMMHQNARAKVFTRTMA